MLANHAKHAAVAAAKLGTAEKNKGLCAVADELAVGKNKEESAGEDEETQ